MIGKCTRCQKETEFVFTINKGPALSWSDPEVDLNKPPVYEASCGDCLTDREIADRLAPITLFAIYAMIARAAIGSELFRSLEHVQARIQMESAFPPPYPPDLRKKVVEAIVSPVAVRELQRRLASAQDSARNWKTLAEGAQNDLHVPGERLCVLCNYRMSGDSKTLCPIDGSVTVDVRWKDAALAASRIASNARSRVSLLEKAWPDSVGMPVGHEIGELSLEEKIDRLREKGLYEIVFRNAGVGLMFFNPPEGVDTEPFTMVEWTIHGETMQVPVSNDEWKKYLSVERYYSTFDEAVESEWNKRK